MGWWSANGGSITQYTTAPNTRSLSVASNIQPTNFYANATAVLALLFYENSNGSVRALVNTVQSNAYTACMTKLDTDECGLGTWIDDSTAWHASFISSLHNVDNISATGLVDAASSDIGTLGAPFTGLVQSEVNFSVTTLFTAKSPDDEATFELGASVPFQNLHKGSFGQGEHRRFPEIWF